MCVFICITTTGSILTSFFFFFFGCDGLGLVKDGQVGFLHAKPQQLTCPSVLESLLDFMI